ncbi:hypothetical protein CROQUDRAFT_93442, partial [Cronartium quercuum f. sp. fusiforme G11]
EVISEDDDIRAEENHSLEMKRVQSEDDLPPSVIPADQNMQIDDDKELKEREEGQADDDKEEEFDKQIELEIVPPQELL